MRTCGLSTVIIEAAEAEFRASGKRVIFPGFFRAYVEGADDPTAALDNQETLLPLLAVGDSTDLKEIEPVQHETKPPARYTDATLVKALESEGIGRPSTYATIISTIQDRGYVTKQGNQLTPTFVAFAVNLLLERYFPDLVDSQFTAHMEQVLDDVAEGSTQGIPYLKEFFLGDAGLENQVKSKEAEIDPREIHALEVSEMDARVRIGPYGPYLEQESNGELIRVSLPENVSPGDLTPEEVGNLLRRKDEAPTSLGDDPETGKPVLVLVGPYGPYVQLGENGQNGDDKAKKKSKPPRVSLPKGVEPTSVTLEYALQLLSLPRKLGAHPETGKGVEAGIGRFGPFVRHDGEYRSLPKEDDVLTIELDRAVQLLAEKKNRRSASMLRELGGSP